MERHELSVTAVSELLTTRWVGRSYHFRERVGSTNDLLQEMVAAGDEQYPPAGTVIVADYQSAGRGRMARRWEVPPGTALLFSTLFRPGWPVERGTWLTMLAAVATAEAIEALTGVAIGLKWPNDLLVEGGGEWCKVGGLLLDSRLDGQNDVNTAVVGIGINVNQTADQLPDAVYPPTSLWLATGRPISRLALLTACLERLEAHYELAASGRSPRAEWHKRLVTLGKRVTVTSNGLPLIEGTAEDVDEWGRLLVREAAGSLQTVAAGDVSLRQREV
jgi:BirA family biotin operon repressor/biotin-[acetyl-CoA-carboxylase] ligase